MTPSQLFLILKSRAFWIALCMLAGVSLALIANQLLKPQYSAGATMLIDTRNPDPVNGTPVSTDYGNTQMTTQLDLIASSRVARKVVRALNMPNDPQQQAAWLAATGGHGEAEAFFAQQLLRGLDVQPNHNSNVVGISYSADNAARAAQIANLFAEAYVESILELKVEPARQIAQWFDTQTRDARSALEKAQARLTDYQATYGVVAITPGQNDLETSRLNALGGQLALMQGAHIETRSRKQEVVNNSHSAADVFNNPVVESLRTEIAKAESALDQLSKQIGVNHPSYQQALQNINTLRDKLNEEMASVARTISSNNAIAENREQALRSAVVAQRQRVLQFSKASADISALRQDVEGAQKALDSLLLRQSQTALQSQAQQTNVLIVARASEPPRPSRPKPLLNIVFGLLIGLCLGCALALIVEWRAPRVRSTRDIADATDLPIIAVLSHHAPQGARLPWYAPWITRREAAHA